MKPETAAFFAKSREFLAKASDLLKTEWMDEAGRAAYYAGFHAAQALIVERTGRSPKSHAGVRTEFSKLVANDPGFDADLRRFLGRAYNLKTTADYDTDPSSQVTSEQAKNAVQMAERFVSRVTDLMATPPPPE